MLGDGDYSNALAPEHGLEGHGVLPLAGEAVELPDENHLEGSRGLAALVDHVAELGPVGDPAALGLVHVLAGDDVAVVLRVIPERPKLGGDGEVHVLAVAGDSRVQGRWGEGLHLFFHAVLSFLMLYILTESYWISSDFRPAVVKEQLSAVPFPSR